MARERPSTDPSERPVRLSSGLRESVVQGPGVPESAAQASVAPGAKGSDEPAARVAVLEARLADAEAMVKALLVGNLDAVLAAARHEGPFRSIVEEALQQGLADRSAVIEQLPCGVVVYDHRGRLLFANPTASDLSGSRKDPRILPTRSLELCPADPVTSRPFDLECLPAARALLGEEVTSFECVIRESFAHEERGLRLSAVPRRDDAGTVIGAICTIIDVTERSRLEKELLQSERMACVGSLAAGMAHEINNPLATILSNVSYVAEEVDACVAAAQDGTLVSEDRLEEVRRALVDARDGAEKIRRVVSDLKTFARAEDDLRHPLDVRGPLEEACQVAETEIRHRAKLIKDFRAVPPVIANEGRLRQLFLNLLLNGAQAVDEAAGETREIRVSTSRGPGDQVIVEVRDTGAGIAPSSLPRVFDPFFSLKPAGHSAGFGLATCESIARAHGGTISVESQVGKGTVFRVSLPFEPATFDELRDRAVVPARRARILVVDDELSVIESIRRVLGREHDVTTTLGALDALAAIASGEDYDLIICDIMMPEVGGPELHAVISEKHPRLLPRLTFMTGGAFTARARAFLESVPNARIAKPFDIAGIRDFVHERLAQSRRRHRGEAAQD